MKTMVVLAGALVAAGAYAGPQDAPESPKPCKEHEWLQQIVGEWDSEAEVTPDPAKPPVKMKGTESSRMIGGFWAMCEVKGEAFNKPFTGIMTLGYDAERKRYVGTWIDSMTGHLWSYQGSLDASGRMLVLDTEGPGRDGKPARFRESIEVKDKDHKIFTSSTEQDGKWLPHMTVRYERKK